MLISNKLKDGVDRATVAGILESALAAVHAGDRYWPPNIEYDLVDYY